MVLENLSQIAIYIHASLGGIALLFGGIALIAQKGRNLHKKAGKVFYYSMLSSAIMALIISFLPNHKSAFLFTIGIFSSYFIVSGYRAIGFKKDVQNLRWDKGLAWGLFVVGLIMISYPVILNKSLNIVLAVFGSFAMIFSIVDMKQYKNPERLKKNWLSAHLGKMIGGYIAATTAFVVVNHLIPGIFAWFVPGIIGGFYIYYWNRKLDKSKRSR